MRLRLASRAARGGCFGLPRRLLRLAVTAHRPAPVQMTGCTNLVFKGYEPTTSNSGNRTMSLNSYWIDFLYGQA